MNKAIIYDTLEQFVENLEGKTISLIDWGCYQGIATMLVLDYIREKQLNIIVSKVILIDDDPKVLSRAMAQVENLKQGSLSIDAIDSYTASEDEGIKTLQSPIIHLFANDTIPVDLSKINLGSGYAVCLSHQNVKTIDNVCNAIGGTQISKREGKIGRFQRFERIVKLSK